MTPPQSRVQSRLAKPAAVLAALAVSFGISALIIAMLLARGCTNVQTKQVAVSPSGKYKAEVISDTGPAIGPIFYWVTVSVNSRWSALPAWLGTAETVLSISNTGEGLFVEWTGRDELTVVCPHCTTDDFSTARTHWRDVTVQLLRSAPPVVSPPTVGLIFSD